MRIKNKALYRASKPEGSLAKLAHKSLLIPPREVMVGSGKRTRKAKVYSIVMAAEALGKSVIQLRAWIKRGLIPPPALEVTNHGYTVYDCREMQIIRKHLYQHTKTGVSYLTVNNIGFIKDLKAEIKEYRSK